MGGKLAKVKKALMGGHRFSGCSYAPLNDASEASSTTMASTEASRPLPCSSVTTSKKPVVLIRRSSSSTKSTCAICLKSLKQGGCSHALFTAECLHSFHFHCIASNINHGNRVCPVCRARWTEIPLVAPPPSANRHARATTPVDPSSETMYMVAPGWRPHAFSKQHNHELSCFDDDEPLSPPPQAHKCNKKCCLHTIECRIYPELLQVQHSISEENFNALIHLKVPTSTVIGSSPTSAKSSTKARAPIDLVTVVDVSGSMAGTKLALLKQAMIFVVQNLDPYDRLSVVSFSQSARRLFHLRKMSESGKEHAIQAINSLAASGGTNIDVGLKKGMKVLKERLQKNPVCSIMLLSDGEDTCFVRPVSALDHRIPIHTFGFGADHNPKRMHSISEASGGTFSFVEAANMIQDAFARCLGGLLSVEAQDLCISVECINPNVHIQTIRSGGYKKHISKDKRVGKVEIGDLYAGEEKDMLLSVNVPPALPSETGTALFKVGCMYKEPMSMNTISLQDVTLEIQRPKVVVGQGISSEVAREKNRLMVADAIADAKDAADRGSLSEASSILEKCRKSLGVAVVPGDRLNIALEAEVKEMQRRMVSRQQYEKSGRAYVLSGLSSHSWQRATARGNCDSTNSQTVLLAYETPSMTDMLHRSQTLIPSPR